MEDVEVPGYVKTAAEASCLALKEGGCDIDSGNTYNDGLRNASYAKDCEIDGAVARSMKVRMDLGLSDPPTGPYWSYGEEKIGTDASRELNLRAAGESLVLLRNPTVGGRAVLPLQKGGRVAVVGPHATSILVQLDSGMICPDDTMGCRAAAIRRHNGGGSVVVKQGHGLFDSATDDNTTVADALAAAAAADVVVLGAGIAQCAGHGHGVRPEDCWHGYFGAEGTDRTHIDLPPSQRDFIAQVLALNKPTAIFVLNGGSVALAPELPRRTPRGRGLLPGRRRGGGARSPPLRRCQLVGSDAVYDVPRGVGRLALDARARRRRDESHVQVRRARDRTVRLRPYVLELAPPPRRAARGGGRAGNRGSSADLNVTLAHQRRTAGGRPS